MKNLLELFERLYSEKFGMKDLNGETIWSQTERNKTRNEIIEAILNDIDEAILNSKLADKGLEIGRTNDGASINIPNKYWGSFVCSIVPKMHGLDYDLEDAVSEYNQKQEEKAIKRKKKEEKDA